MGEGEIGEKYLVLIIERNGVYDKASDIYFRTLLSRFVLKANQGSGMIIIVKDKNSIDENYIRDRADKWLRTYYGIYGMEVQYFHIELQVIAEQYIEHLAENLYDFKIYYFNGKTGFINLIGNRVPGKHKAKYTPKCDNMFVWNFINLDNGVKFGEMTF